MTFALAYESSIFIRPLTADDSQAYQELRQRVLEIGDGRHFSDSYMREKQLRTHRAWREWCTEKSDHCIFGTFDAQTLIGVMMVTQYHGFGDQTVEWEAIWLDPRYREQGIAKMAYGHLRDWTRDHGYDRVVLFIRADNLRSLYIHQKLGARYVCTKRDEVWADGSIADVHTFILDLDKIAQESPLFLPTYRRGAASVVNTQLVASLNSKHQTSSRLTSSCFDHRGF